MHILIYITYVVNYILIGLLLSNIKSYATRFTEQIGQHHLLWIHQCFILLCTIAYCSLRKVLDLCIDWRVRWSSSSLFTAMYRSPPGWYLFDLSFINSSFRLNSRFLFLLGLFGYCMIRLIRLCCIALAPFGGLWRGSSRRTHSSYPSPSSKLTLD